MSSELEKRRFDLNEILTPYEFEERADHFVREVNDLVQKFPDLLIEAENKTTTDLEANGRTLKHFIGKTSEASLKKAQKLYSEGFRMDKESADEMKALVAVFGNKKKLIEVFAKKVEAIAKFYGGKKSPKSEEITDFGEGAEDGDYKYFSGLIYTFRS